MVIKGKWENFLTYWLETEFSIIIPILPIVWVQTHIRNVRGEALNRASGEELTFILCPFPVHGPAKSLHRHQPQLDPGLRSPSQLLTHLLPEADPEEMQSMSDQILGAQDNCEVSTKIGEYVRIFICRRQFTLMLSSVGYVFHPPFTSNNIL